jgi:hypothetical protein
MRQFAVIVLLTAIWLIGNIASTAYAHEDQITVVIPAFNGPGSLGKAVATILKLQIARNFRKEDPKRPGATLGRGSAYWVPAPLPALDNAQAQKLARINGAQMTLWGTALPYSDGVVVQAYLSIPEPYRDFRETSYEMWTVQVGGRAIILGVPRSDIEFAFVGITKPLVERYNSGDYLKFCQNRQQSECVQAQWNEVYRVLKWEGDDALVEFRGSQYWIHTPDIDRNQSVIVSYVSGVVEYYRGDWGGVLTQMDKVVSNEASSTELKIDALIYEAVAKYRSNQIGKAELRRALELNEFSARTIRYMVTALIYEASISPPGSPERQSLAKEATKLLAEKQYLFASTDEWTRNASYCLEHLTSS